MTFDPQRLHGALAHLGSAELGTLVKGLGFEAVAAQGVARRGRMMLPLHDPVSATRFYLGEILVCEAVAQEGSQEAYFLRVGDCETAARNGAAILLAWQSRPDMRPAIEAAVTAAETDRQARRARTRAATRATRVRFEGGEVEAYASSDFTTDR